MKWFWSDWRSDPNLHACSLAARGLWAEMLGIMYFAVPYGHLLVNGRQISIAELALQVGRPVPEVKRAFTELGKHLVYSMTDDGIVYSRRMVRDAKRSRTAKSNGARGGNPMLRILDNQNLANLDNQNSRSSDNQNVGSTPEARSQIPTASLREAFGEWADELWALLGELPDAVFTEAAAFHNAVEAALKARGWTVQREVSVPDRGDGRPGVIDLLVTEPMLLSLELDYEHAREKSLRKLALIPGARGVLLRSPSSDVRTLIGDGVIVLGRGPRREYPADPPRRFLNAYSALYKRVRSGASYLSHVSRDLNYAADLLAHWPDESRLLAMAEVFLRREDIGPKNVPGTLGQFRHMAPDCDALLKRNGR